MKILVLVVVLVASLVILPYVLLCLLAFSWSITNGFLVGIAAILVILLYIYVWTTVTRRIRNKKAIHKRQHLMYGGSILLCCAILGGYSIYNNYLNHYGEVDSEVDLHMYEPYANNKLPSLDKEATLAIKQPVPRLDGATALYPLYSALTQNLYPEGEYSAYVGDVTCNTTPTAYEMLLKKEKDLIFVAGPSKNQEMMFQKAGEEMVLTPIGKESFVFFVNVKNPVDSLSIQQIQDIYAGKVTNWKEVGGKDEKIRAFQRPEESGSQTALLKLMGDIKLMDPIKEDVAEGMGGIISRTANYQNRDNAIGYSFRFFTDEMVKNKEIKLLKIDGVEPNIQNIQNDTYPITSAFYAIKLKSNTDVQSQQLLTWLTSSQGKELIEKSGYVPY